MTEIFKADSLMEYPIISLAYSLTEYQIMLLAFGQLENRVCRISSIIPIFDADEAKYCDITDHRIFIGIICPAAGYSETKNP